MQAANQDELNPRHIKKERALTELILERLECTLVARDEQDSEACFRELHGKLSPDARSAASDDCPRKNENCRTGDVQFQVLSFL